MSKTREELVAEVDAAKEAALEAEKAAMTAIHYLNKFDRAEREAPLCAEWVWSSDGWYTHRCSRKKGYGKDGAYCKQHAKKHPEEAAS